MYSQGKLLVFHFLMCFRQIGHGFKIINGNIAPGNSMQYMVSMQSKYGHHVCGGFLIREDFVVTAAHCARDISQILLGSHNLKGGNGKLIQAGRSYLFPNFTGPGSGDDIMLVKLSEKVPLNNNIKTIPLPTSEINLEKHQTCSVAGWGKIYQNSPLVNELRVVNVSIINPQTCQKTWGDRLPRNVICAGGYNTEKGFCQGDSGGPLVCERKAVGVVSFNQGYNCNYIYPNVPNVYTDLFKYVPWIETILRENEY